MKYPRHYSIKKWSWVLPIDSAMLTHIKGHDEKLFRKTPIVQFGYESPCSKSGHDYDFSRSFPIRGFKYNLVIVAEMITSSGTSI